MTDPGTAILVAGAKVGIKTILKSLLALADHEPNLGVRLAELCEQANELSAIGVDAGWDRGEGVARRPVVAQYREGRLPGMVADALVKEVPDVKAAGPQQLEQAPLPDGVAGKLPQNWAAAEEIEELVSEAPCSDLVAVRAETRDDRVEQAGRHLDVERFGKSVGRAAGVDARERYLELGGNVAVTQELTGVELGDEARE